MSIDKQLEYYRNHFDKSEQENQQLRSEIKQSQIENQQLRSENQQLRIEIAELKQTTSALVARNIRAKPNRVKPNKKKSISKHQRKSRSRPTHIDHSITVDQKECNICQTKLSSPTDSYTRIVEDIIPAKVVVTQYKIIRRYCTSCKKQTSANINTALPNERFGIRLMALIISLKTVGLSYGKISHLLQLLFSLHITESAIIQYQKHLGIDMIQ